MAAVLSYFVFQMSLRTQTQVIRILGPDNSAEREIGSPSLLLPHLHVHCAQEGLGEEVEESVKAFEPSARWHPQKSIDTLAVCMEEMLGSRGALQRSCCSCYGETWVTQKQNIM